jgi:hypothetical protein
LAKLELALSSVVEKRTVPLPVMKGSLAMRLIAQA